MLTVACDSSLSVFSKQQARITKYFDISLGMRQGFQYETARRTNGKQLAYDMYFQLTEVHIFLRLEILIIFLNDHLIKYA